MKQVIQNFRTGELSLVEVPAPMVSRGRLVVRTVRSAVSVGTERQMLDFARRNLIGKALARPDLVRKVLSVVRTEGVQEAFRVADSRLDTPVPLGYSSAGEIIDIGSGVEGFKIGTRVACTGTGYASHSEIISLPPTLCAPVPDRVDFDSAAFAALGGIALHALREASPSLGDRIAILGVGLLGQLAVQLARTSGCRVLALDIDPKKVELSLEHGAEAGAVIGSEDVVSAASAFSGGHGVDAVLIFAATPSNQPIEVAADIARVRGRVIAPGLIGLNIPRKMFYEKELVFRISRAWGPGLYDPDYEHKGRDYPYTFVRWTAQRNIVAFLELLAEGKVRLDRIITHRFPIDQALDAYKIINSSDKPCIGVLLMYPTEPGRVAETKGHSVSLRTDQPTVAASTTGEKRPVVLGVIGAGNFSKATLLPAAKSVHGVEFRGVVTATGISGRHTGEKYGFSYCTTDPQQILDDPQINCVMIATRHHWHAQQTAAALRAGKDVFVEKPLALTVEELQIVRQAFEEASEKKAAGRAPILFVGFNRRFSPFTIAVKKWLAFTDIPMVINVRVNAGFVAADSWVQDAEQGGGRILGEVCHFADLIHYLTDSATIEVCTYAMKPAAHYRDDDNIVVGLRLADGSVASIVYSSSGDKAYPRERVEVLRGGAVCLIDNFRFASLTRNGVTHRKRSFNVDRGHCAETKAFFAAVREGGPSPVALEDYACTTLTTIRILESLRQGRPLEVVP